MRTWGGPIFRRLNAYLRILHFRTGERATADPAFLGGRTRTCGSLNSLGANAHLQILRFRAGERAPADPPFLGG